MITRSRNSHHLSDQRSWRTSLTGTSANQNQLRHVGCCDITVGWNSFLLIFFLYHFNDEENKTEISTIEIFDMKDDSGHGRRPVSYFRSMFVFLRAQIWRERMSFVFFFAVVPWMATGKISARQHIGSLYPVLLLRPWRKDRNKRGGA